MSHWITMTVLSFAILMVLEEGTYYGWNRIVYGPNIEARRKWKNRGMTMIRFFKRKQVIEVDQSNEEKSSHF
ncbi:hypothetical protein FAY30_10745 [Bacillus sp. S3]|uniref:hypothetical protein n=1 Tax=Bacillus sp. S3 TaxID=486398 RepID=UPI00118966A6|nr:hypothetical protein [Bacillus sp. S3]QCJ42347.1 hypothetical protein FAY30_10745 [Bacillus sp. S3]